jgi:hypothetical protein
VAALSESEWLVRLEAAKALVNLPDPDAVRPLLDILGNENEQLDVRIAAADALQHYRSLEVGRMLVGALQERSFGIAWQARRSLIAMTRHDLGYDQGQWLNYLTGPERPFAGRARPQDGARA